MMKNRFLGPFLLLIIGSVFLINACADSSSDGDIDVILLYNAGEHNGNFDDGGGARAGIDELCSNSSNKPAGTTVHALISIDAADTVKLMPQTYGFSSSVPIKNVDETATIADDWADLTDGTIQINFSDAGILESSTSLWWSGSDASGDLYTNRHCAGWTSEEVDVEGSIGSINLISYSSTPCMMGRYVVCVAY